MNEASCKMVFAGFLHPPGLQRSRLTGSINKALNGTKPINSENSAKIPVYTAKIPGQRV